MLLAVKSRAIFLVSIGPREYVASLHLSVIVRAFFPVVVVGIRVYVSSLMFAADNSAFSHLSTGLCVIVASVLIVVDDRAFKRVSVGVHLHIPSLHHTVDDCAFFHLGSTGGRPHVASLRAVNECAFERDPAGERS